jgi:hypothetical protein
VVERGIDVASAGQENTVEISERSSAVQFQQARFSPCASNRFDIVG